MATFFDIPADLDTPVSAFLKLGPLSPRFLLESVVNGESVGRYSIVGFGACDRIRIDRGGVHRNGEKLQDISDAASVLAGLRGALESAPRLGPAPPDVPFVGGLVGYSSFELAHHLEGLSIRGANDVDLLAEYVAPRSLLIFDHTTLSIALLHAGSESEHASLRRDVLDLLRGPIPKIKTAGAFGVAEPSFDRAGFEDAVADVKELIRAGEVYQLVLSTQFRRSCTLPPIQVYRALRHLNPSPYMYLLKMDERTVVGSSPEALVTLNGRSASLRPIAGTRPRGRDAAEDAAFEHDLRDDPKEIAEHIMLVDLARNDVGRVATPGTVKVDPYQTVERYSHVMHLVSGVNATVDDSFDAFDLFAATFPAGTVSGAPKIRAMEHISRLEPVPRGPYAGTVGYFGHGDTMDQAITIRTLFFEQDTCVYQAGAGIVADSVPSNEHQEVLAKSAIMQAALELAGGLE